MIIKLADHYGLCFGVRDAIAEATRLVQQGPLTILGELAHNPIVRERLARAGVREGSLQQPAKTGQVLITAHGASDTARGAWRRAGHGVADATCPLVHHAHQQLQMLVTLGFAPVVIGKHGHVEVNGLIGDFPQAFVVQTEADIERLPEEAKLGVVSQTTQPIDAVLELVAAIRIARPRCEVRFVDTVCQPTKNRQLALRKLIAECDTLVVVGGRNSNNTLQLVAAGLAAGLLVYHIERPDELRVDWFADSNVVGLTAGTSTLKETVAEVHAMLVRIGEQCASGDASRTEAPLPRSDANAA